MKNDNRLVEFTIFVLLITIIAISLVAGTFAKYTSAVSGSSTATVAKWTVKLNDKDATTTDSVTLDLFQSTGGVYDLKGLAANEDLSTITTPAVDEDVAKGGKVAPGTWGKVAFEVKNESEVKADYVITINSLTTTLPLQFSEDGKTWKTVSDITTSGFSFNGGTLDIGSTTPQTATATLYWKWDFDAAGNKDTELGHTGTETCVIDAGVTFTQVD